METPNNPVCKLKYPYLTQLFGLSGWKVFTPIIITKRRISRIPHIDLKSRNVALRIIEDDGWLVKDEGPQCSVKNNWCFYWDQPIYDETGKFTSQLRTALLSELYKEKLVGYIFRNPQLHFSPSETAYLNTNYILTDEENGEEIVIGVGKLNLPLNDFLIRRKSRSWTFVTACNPSYQPLSEEENKTRQQGLTRLLKEKGIDFLNGYAESGSRDWHPLPGAFLFDADPQTTMSLGRSFGQNALPTGQINRAPELICCG